MRFDSTAPKKSGFRNRPPIVRPPTAPEPPGPPLWPPPLRVGDPGLVAPLTGRRMPAQLAVLRAEIGAADYRAGFRDTVGWSRRPDVPEEGQPHLQIIETGSQLMEALAPGLRAELSGALAAQELLQEAIQTLDRKLVEEVSREGRTRREAEKKNVRLLEMAADRHELWIQAEEHADRARAAAAPKMARLQFALLRRHGPAARRRADAIRVDEGLRGVVDGTRLRTWARAFFALVGPNAPVPERLRFVKGTSRAMFDAAAGEIRVGPDVDAATVFHELGHAMEVDVFDAMLAAEAWREARAFVADPRVKPARLRELCPGAKYGPEELALPDHFITPYVGKVYEVFGSEVVSMGLEHLATAKGMVRLFEQDPEHFLFTLGLLEEIEP